MLTLVPGLAALTLYLGLAGWQWSRWQQRTPLPRTPLLSVAALALALHAISVYGLIDTAAGFHFGFFHVSSLIFWVIGVILVICSLKLPVESLLGPLFGLTAIGIASSLFIPSPYTPRQLGYPIALHILLSILAYSILTIASVQALALALQDRLLKSHQWQRSVGLLPPLQTMESLLFEMVTAGTCLLALSIGTGLLFFEDIRAQHLAHKMILSVLALLVYCVLLWGRHARGWRGKQAIRWTLGGFSALMLAYFGTKLVLELILNRA